MADGTCSIGGCGRPVLARGWCVKHWRRWRKHGDPLYVREWPTVCSVDDCSKPVKALGWCSKHHSRWLRHGDPLREGPSELDRVLAHINRGLPDDCWPWTGFISKGYGRSSRQHVNVGAHRHVYELMVGPVPDGMTLDHLCHRSEECAGGETCPHRRCCNPAHLEPVPIEENVMRGNAPAAVNARRDRCRRGHLFDEANTYIARNGSRNCRACRRELDRERRRARAQLRRGEAVTESLWRVGGVSLNQGASMGSPHWVPLEAGRKFGRLTVTDPGVRKISASGRSRPGAGCRCDCGAEVVVGRWELLSGSTLSCGCLGRERRAAGRARSRMQALLPVN